jgi:hypothetical protein
MICKKNIFIGFIKVGYKHLFIYDEIGTPMEINPLCVLDFYTYETCQRKGYGKIMFSEMLEKEKIEARKMGYDRPSHKFINFLNKYYGLKNYVPQNNNYVVFKDYFDDVPKKRDKYDIYSNNYTENYNRSYYGKNITQKNNDYYNYNSNNKSNNYINENRQYNNIGQNKIRRDDKNFCAKIYREYNQNKNNNDINNDDKKEEIYKKEEFRNNNSQKFSSFIYRPSSSEYGAFFNLNK